MIQLRRTGSNKPVEVRTKPEGPDEVHEAPAHISERINVEPTAGETARFEGEPPRPRPGSYTKSLVPW